MLRLLPVVFCALLLHLNAAGLYQRAEESITWSGHGLSNPFTDVELRLSITAPSGRTLGSSFTFYGFYDGNGSGGQSGDVWKYRILLDTPGTWTVKAKFVNPGTSTQKSGAPGERTFTYSVSSTNVSGEHGHARVDGDNSSRFSFDDGTPFVPFSMHSSMLMDQSWTTAKTWIDNHASRGVNALAVRFHSEISDAMGGTGHWHYLSRSGARVTAYDYNDFDYTRFDVASWHHNEDIVEYAQSKGMRLSIWFGISGLNTQYWSYGPKDYPNNTTLGTKQKLFIRYFLARWAAYTAWWHWTVDSEYEETGSGALDRVKTYAAALGDQNPWKTVVTTHVLRDWTPGSASQFDMATLQQRVDDTNSGATSCRSFITDNDQYGKPVYNCEGVWALSNVTRSQIATLAHLFAGGFSHVAHNGDGQGHAYSSWGCVWSTVNPRHKEDAAMLGKLTTFFNGSVGSGINDCTPQHSLVSVSGGHLARCLADPGRTYYIWADEGGTVSLDLSGIPGTFSVVRYAGDALASPVSRPDITGGGTRSLGATPATGFGNDYLYVVTVNASSGLAIATSSVPDGYRGTAWTATFSALNASGTVTWSKSAGSFPPGLGLSGATLSGTPTDTGSYTFTIKAQDSGSSAEKQYTVVIREPAETDPPVVTGVRVLNHRSGGATVAWDTNEPATSRVQWGSSPGNYTGDSHEESTLRINHAVHINGAFSEGQTWYLLIMSVDSLGNAVTCPDSFTVSLPAPLTVTLAAYHGTGETPQVVNDGFGDGAVQCLDRTGPPEWSGVSAELTGLTYLLTARDDKSDAPAEDAVMYDVTVSAACTVFTVFTSAAAVPTWTGTDGWQSTGLAATANGEVHRVYRKAVGAGTVDLKRQKDVLSQGTAFLFKPGPGTPALVGGLSVNDGANAADWGVGRNLQAGDVQYGDREYTLTAVPAGLAGSDWIRTANDSKAYTGTVVTFTVHEATDMYVAHNDMISAKPTWLAGWTDSGLDMVNDEADPVTFSLYKKTFASGATVTLGENGGDGEGMYTVVVAAAVTSAVGPVPAGAAVHGVREAVWFDVQGRRMVRPGTYGVYCRVVGGAAKMVFVGE